MFFTTIPAISSYVELYQSMNSRSPRLRRSDGI
jgi:hypothetical protein